MSEEERRREAEVRAHYEEFNERMGEISDSLEKTRDDLQTLMDWEAKFIMPILHHYFGEEISREYAANSQSPKLKETAD